MKMALVEAAVQKISGAEKNGRSTAFCVCAINRNAVFFQTISRGPDLRRLVIAEDFQPPPVAASIV